MNKFYILLSNYINKNQHIFKYHKTYLLLIAVLILFFRRPGQFLYPYIWDEDATVILRDYIGSGFLSIFSPVQGYYVLSSKIINFLSYSISFWYYPEIASFFANLYIIFIIFAIAYSPTYLKLPWLCAILTLLVRTDSECFGIALYSFWWSGILLILAALWKENCKLKLRVFYILLGGFSSPLICFASPLICIRAILKRSRDEIFAAVISLFPFLVQTYTILFISSRINIVNLFSFNTIRLIVSKFFLNYIIIDQYDILSKIIGILFFLLIIISGVIFIKKSGLKNILNYEILSFLCLYMWLLASIIMSITAANINILHPFYAGPRYFFYPYIILSWILIYFFHTTLQLHKHAHEQAGNERLNSFKIRLLIPIIYLVLSLSFLFDGRISYMSRDHNYINFRQELAAALQTDNYSLPIHYDGYSDPWLLNINRHDLIKLIQNSLIFKDIDINTNNSKNKYKKGII